VLRGRHHLRSREEASLLRSIELFSEAIEFDPHFGEAYRDLARAYALLPTYSYEDPDEMFDLAETALDQGVAMDPSLDEEVYDVRAFLHYSRWEWSAAEEDFRRALEHTPNDPNLHQWYSQQLAAVGKPELALEAVLQAKALDVLSPTINQRLAVVYQWVDDDEKAYQQFELASELGLGPRANPESYVIQLLRRGDYETARELLLDLQRAFRRASHWVDPFIAALKDPARRPDALDALRVVADERQISLKYLQGALVLSATRKYSFKDSIAAGLRPTAANTFASVSSNSASNLPHAARYSFKCAAAAVLSPAATAASISALSAAWRPAAARSG
jgi:tetratricopeptide (TPR) repeat protein